MADTVQFDLVSPERKLASVKAVEVQIPGANGYMTAMADHAPVITTLRPGVLKVIGPEGSQSFAVTGGFAEIGPAAVTVLAERALPGDADNRAEIEAYLTEARKTAADATADRRDAAEILVADLVQLLDDMR